MKVRESVTDLRTFDVKGLGNIRPKTESKTPTFREYTFILVTSLRWYKKGVVTDHLHPYLQSHYICTEDPFRGLLVGDIPISTDYSIHHRRILRE